MTLSLLLNRGSRYFFRGITGKTVGLMSTSYAYEATDHDVVIRGTKDSVCIFRMFVLG